MPLTERVRARVALRARQLAKMAELGAHNLRTRETALDPSGPVVSLTTFGRRIRTVGFTIESIARGAQRPSRLVLWLDEAALLERPTAMLRRLQARGVELRPTENYGPHKKYYPFVASQGGFDRPLVTADDDVVYPHDWLERLMAQHRAYPDDVHCYRSRVMAMDGERFAPYSSWRDCESTTPSHRHFSVGMAGVLFPPRVLAELKQQGEAFKASCPRTDDIWLNLHAQRVGAKVRQVHDSSRHFMLLPGTQKVGLLHDNVQARGGNDVALETVYEHADLLRLRELG